MKVNPPPSHNKEFETIYTNAQGQEEYGERVVDGHKEIVHIPSGKSNMTYYTPETVLDPTGCHHYFVFTSIGLREIECLNCHFCTTVHAGINYREEGSKAYLSLKGKDYPIDIPINR